VPKRAGFTGYQKMGLGPLDAILGAAAALLAFLIGRRLAWVKSAVRDIGVLGTTLAVMAIVIFTGAVLLEFRLMPGPAFTAGAVAASAVILAVRRRTDGLRLVPRLPFPTRLDPLVLLGVITGAAGLAIAIRAAWVTDIAYVNAILRTIT
jgi:hypothetical protein